MLYSGRYDGVSPILENLPFLLKSENCYQKIYQNGSQIAESIGSQYRHFERIWYKSLNKIGIGNFYDTDEKDGYYIDWHADWNKVGQSVEVKLFVKDVLEKVIGGDELKKLEIPDI